MAASQCTTSTLNIVVLFWNLDVNVWACFQCALVILLIHVFVIRLDFVLYWYLFPSVTGLYVCRAWMFVYLFMLYSQLMFAIQLLYSFRRRCCQTLSFMNVLRVMLSMSINV